MTVPRKTGGAGSESIGGAVKKRRGRDTAQHLSSRSCTGTPVYGLPFIAQIWKRLPQDLSVKFSSHINQFSIFATPNGCPVIPFNSDTILS